MTYEKYFHQILDALAATDKPALNYPDGCVMSGAQYMFEATGDDYYKNAILAFGDKYVSADGTIRGFDENVHNVDQLRCGNLLFFLHKHTGENRYQSGISKIMDNLRTHPRTGEGSFWHKAIYPYQVWLDGLYMAMPFYLMYENASGGCKNYNDVADQFRRVRKNLWDGEKKLYRHAWDESRRMGWADKTTGQSPNVWLRAVGWWVMALVDCFELFSEEAYDQRRLMQDLLQETLNGLLPYRDAQSGLFYQLVDLAGAPGNYLETSGSAMVAYALLKGSRLGMLHHERYAPMGEEILCSIQGNLLPFAGGALHLQNICGSAGLGPTDAERDGSVEYYFGEPVVPDNLHGVAGVMMAWAEWRKYQNIREAL